MKEPSEGTIGASQGAAALSGAVAGLLVVFIGIIASEFGEPIPGSSLLGPSMAGAAAALAAAVAAYRSRSPMGVMLALAVGAFLVTYFVSAWLTHWIGVGTLIRRHPLTPQELGWRRDLAICLIGIAVGSFLGAFLGRR
jgi:hypothetical protein